MLWFTVWAVLVVASLVGGFLLVRRLYRSGRALLAELGRASEALATVADGAEEPAASGWAPAPVDLTDPEPARARRALADQAAAARRAARAARHEETYRRWQALSR